MTETKKRKMSAAQRRERRRKIRNRRIAMTFALVLVVALASVGGTIAWLTAKTDAVTNTFTVGDINITLAETTGTNYKIVPGNDITKDPKVTVAANSEACWLFVKIDEANWPTVAETGSTTRKVNYAIATGWTALEGVNGVYYRAVDTAATAQDFYVLADNKVTVSGNLTKAEVNAITTSPTLTFTAYACQKDSNITTAAGAWSKIQAASTT